MEAWANMEKVLRAELGKEERLWKGATPREVSLRLAGFLDKMAVAKVVTLEWGEVEFFKEQEMEQEDDAEEDKEEGSVKATEATQVSQAHLPLSDASCGLGAS